ncbi:hypothetical protein [Paenibacillus glycinis]|uniref:Uncharacterized protein n=1 Tax=Paenibacillus glycinis TaxID=2697035 RepID=A0ABW9Y0D5_9BACL|nr:hypothetical protein [Paenibacillus glycinis]NBD28191.1 hypothetical protein [Paenibacillus glycinis]
MIIHFNQTKTNLKKVIEVEEDGELIYQINMPATAKFFSTTMTSKGDLVYRTSFQLGNNLKNLIPFKWLWSKQISEACLVCDRNGNIIGAMRNVQEEALLSYNEVILKDEHVKIYEVTKKHNLHLLIFLEGNQIGQIEKSLRVRNNLDRYALFLLDDFLRFKDMLILFVGYFDNWNDSNIGEIEVGKREVVWEWSYSKANAKYDRKWLQHHFDLSKGHIAAIENEQMNLFFKLLFVFVGVAGFAVILFFCFSGIRE